MREGPLHQHNVRDVVQLPPMNLFRVKALLRNRGLLNVELHGFDITNQWASNQDAKGDTLPDVLYIWGAM